jgi:hypothetical protein
MLHVLLRVGGQQMLMVLMGIGVHMVMLMLALLPYVFVRVGGRLMMPVFVGMAAFGASDASVLLLVLLPQLTVLVGSRSRFMWVLLVVSIVGAVAAAGAS